MRPREDPVICYRPTAGDQSDKSPESSLFVKSMRLALLSTLPRVTVGCHAVMFRSGDLFKSREHSGHRFFGGGIFVP